MKNKEFIFNVHLHEQTLITFIIIGIGEHDSDLKMTKRSRPEAIIRMGWMRLLFQLLLRTSAFAFWLLSV